MGGALRETVKTEPHTTNLCRIETKAHLIDPMATCLNKARSQPIPKAPSWIG
jgi:hypothetical protein